MNKGRDAIDTRLPGWSAEQGAATVTALLAVVALLGVCGAFLTTTLRSQIERESVVGEYAAVQVADAGVALAMARLTQGSSDAIGSEQAPWEFGAGDCVADVVENDDGTFTITSRARVGRVVAGVEAVVKLSEETAIYQNAVFAGNSSASGNYTLKVNGKDEFLDEIYGDIYSGGNINLLQEALLVGTARATKQILGVDGEEGVVLDIPDLQAMDYASLATFDVNELFAKDGAYYDWAAPGGVAWQLPEVSPGHIFRKNPTDRLSRLNLTEKDDFFLEDPYEPNGEDAKQTGEDPSEITLSGVGGEPGSSSNQAVFFIDGNLWLDNAPTSSFRFKHGTQAGIQVTFVVMGNIYFGDNLFYENPETDGVAFIAMKDPDVEDSGNISFGDPTGGTLKEMHAFMYAENDFVDINLDESGSQSVRLYGNMTAGNQVDIQRDYGAKHTKMIVEFDERIMNGDLDQPGIPTSSADPENPSIEVLSWRKLSAYDVTQTAVDDDSSDQSGAGGAGGDGTTGSNGKH